MNLPTDRDRARQVDELVSQLEPKIQRSFKEGLNKISTSFSLSEIEEAIENGDLLRASNLITELIVTTAFLEFNDEVLNAIQKGGDLARRWARAEKLEFALNVTESRTANLINTYQTNRVRELTVDLQRTVGALVRQGISEGVGPRKVARQIRDSVGLTSRQAAAVENFRRLLNEDISEALTRELRDKRFDRTLLNALASKKPLTQVQIDKMVARYTEKYINYRALTVARTETIRLLNLGAQEYWRQAISAGVVQEQQLRKKWIPTYDGRLREAHASIPRLNKNGVPFNQPFKSTLGEIMFPGDPGAVAANTINCRCAMFVRIDPILS